MQIPSIHLNGTSSGMLLKQNAEALVAIDRALDVLVQAAPHGRDYYVQGDTAFLDAQKEHEARVSCLRGVRDELIQLVEEIENQIANRQRR